MSTEVVLLIVLILFLLGALPTWPYSRTWGWTPVGALLFVILILILLSLTGTIRVRASVDTDDLLCSASSSSCQA
jgi:hypothetical protein